MGTKEKDKYKNDTDKWLAGWLASGLPLDTLVPAYNKKSHREDNSHQPHWGHT